jgi:DNA anti-recombination protein RmuC
MEKKRERSAEEMRSSTEGRVVALESTREARLLLMLRTGEETLQPASAIMEEKSKGGCNELKCSVHCGEQAHKKGLGEEWLREG